MWVIFTQSGHPIAEEIMAVMQEMVAQNSDRASRMDNAALSDAHWLCKINLDIQNTMTLGQRRIKTVVALFNIQRNAEAIVSQAYMSLCVENGQALTHTLSSCFAKAQELVHQRDILESIILMMPEEELFLTDGIKTMLIETIASTQITLDYTKLCLDKNIRQNFAGKTQTVTTPPVSLPCNTDTNGCSVCLNNTRKTALLRCYRCSYSLCRTCSGKVEQKCPQCRVFNRSWSYM